MFKDAKMKTVDANSDDRKVGSVYTRPEVFSIGLANDLIQGPMIEPYWDCVGQGKTLTRPNC